MNRPIQSAALNVWCIMVFVIISGSLVPSHPSLARPHTQNVIQQYTFLLPIISRPSTVDIISLDTYTYDLIGRYALAIATVGEVQNNNDFNLYNVQMIRDCGNQGSFNALLTGGALLPVMSPGQKVPFYLDTFPYWAGACGPIQITSWMTQTDQIFDDLTVVSSELGIHPIADTGYVRISATGKVQKNHLQTWTQVYVVATLRQKDYSIVDTGQFTITTQLPSNATLPYTITFNHVLPITTTEGLQVFIQSQGITSP